MYTLFRRGRPLWLTSLPFHDSPGMLAFAVAMARALALTYACIFALFPFFSWRHGGEFDFSYSEAFFFAFVFAFFEDHARWNFIVNARRPFIAATKFATYISLFELLFFYLPQTESVSLLHVAYVRAPAIGLHFLLGYIAACVYKKCQLLMFAVFTACVTAHACFNIFDLGRQMMDALGWIDLSL